MPTLLSLSPSLDYRVLKDGVPRRQHRQERQQQQRGRRDQVLLAVGGAGPPPPGPRERGQDFDPLHGALGCVLGVKVIVPRCGACQALQPWYHSRREREEESGLPLRYTTTRLLSFHFWAASSHLGKGGRGRWSSLLGADLEKRRK